ncbi:MAG TPA: 30S ribosomal protein S9 [Opitutae bacterium]|nr:30S ribosomal protein S9 [Opitutae bacterium]
MMAQQAVYIGTGRRKTASARVRITPGTGKISINGRALEEYCYTDQLAQAVLTPLNVANKRNTVDTTILVEGGGPIGQAGAMSHGLARALQKMDAELRPPLKKEGLLRRDPRAKERKKSGQPGARKKFQFSKR